MVEVVSHHFTPPGIMTSASTDHYWRLTLRKRLLGADRQKVSVYHCTVNFNQKWYIYSVEGCWTPKVTRGSNPTSSVRDRP